jgi:hypothetical protein
MLSRWLASVDELQEQRRMAWRSSSTPDTADCVSAFMTMRSDLAVCIDVDGFLLAAWNGDGAWAVVVTLVGKDARVRRPHASCSEVDAEISCRRRGRWCSLKPRRAVVKDGDTSRTRAEFSRRQEGRRYNGVAGSESCRSISSRPSWREISPCVHDPSSCVWPWHVYRIHKHTLHPVSKKDESETY